MKLIRLLLTVLLPLSLISCDKDNDPAPEKSKEELLTAHAWKMEEITQVENNTLIYYKGEVQAIPLITITTRLHFLQPVRVLIARHLHKPIPLPGNSPITKRIKWISQSRLARG